MAVQSCRQTPPEVNRLVPRCRAAAIVPLAMFVVLVQAVAPAKAGPISQLFVFGDSLSDIGNVSQATASIPFIPTTPGPYYYQGRFSNGPNYAELIATGLGLTPLNHSRAGGTDFAYGGAKSSGTGFPDNLVVRDVDDQVGDFLGSQTVDPNALFIVFVGANDLLDGQMNMSIPVGRIATDIGRLVTAGARNFLVPNLPLLGYTPRFNGNSATMADYNMRSQQFNSAIATMLDGLEAGNSTLSVFRFDVAGLFGQAVSDPQAFGLTNITEPAAPGLQPGDTSYDTELIVSNPQQYMFWDDLHPTAAVHAILAQHVLDLFRLPGDFNIDDVVDAADYVVWRKTIGTISAYDKWRANFGLAAGGETFSVVPVPQPASATLLIVAIVCLPIFFGIRHRHQT